MDKGLSLSEPQFPEQGNEDPPRARGGVRELIPNKCATNNVMADWMFPIATGLIMTWLFFWWQAHLTACRILVLNHGSNLCPLQWKLGVLTTG